MLIDIRLQIVIVNIDFKMNKQYLIVLTCQNL